MSTHELADVSALLGISDNRALADLRRSKGYCGEVVACEANFEMMAELAQLYIDHLQVVRLCVSYFAFNH